MLAEGIASAKGLPGERAVPCVCVCERLGKEARVTSAESAMGKSRRGRVKEVMGRPSRPL